MRMRTHGSLLACVDFTGLTAFCRGGLDGADCCFSVDRGGCEDFEVNSGYPASRFL